MKYHSRQGNNTGAEMEIQNRNDGSPQQNRAVYYNDAMGCYLVISCPGEMVRGYQYKMVTANHISGLLQSDFRSINGEGYLYYDITGRISLKILLERGRFETGQILPLLESLADTDETIAAFLLNPDRLCLDPEFIFYDICEQQFLFTYFPGEQSFGILTGLLQSLLANLQGQSPVQDQVLYRLMEMAEAPGFVLTRRILSPLCGTQYVETRQPDSLPELPGQQPLLNREKEDDWEPGIAEDNPEEAEPDPLPEEEQQESTPSAKRQFRTLFLAIFFLGFSVVLEALRFRVRLDAQTLTLARAGVVAGLSLAMITAVYGTWTSFRYGSTPKRRKHTG